VNEPLRRTAWAILAGFLVLAVATTWVQGVAGPDYRDDPRNPRLVASRVGRERGAIVTAESVVVAQSDPAETGQTFERSYPTNEEYAHTVGFVSVLFGARGLEQERAGDLVSNRDATISGVLNVLMGGDPRPRGLRLTIRDDLQTVAREALGDQRGAVFALDPQTGAVLAAVSSPGFDPNPLVGPDAAPEGRVLEDDPGEPLVDRTIERTYPPGSVFKVVTTAAALDAGVAGPSTEFPDPVELILPGSTSTISNADGGTCGNGSEVTLEQAFIASCNTVFAALGMELGAEQLADAASAFGFNQTIPYDLDVLASVFPDARAFATDAPAMAQNAIGQRDVRATPIQMALVAAAVANGGEIMIPHVVSDVFTADGEIESSTTPTLWRRATSPASAAVLTDMMERVVTSGTGRNAAVPGVRIAGKTGTAEVSDGRPHAWFVGFGPVAPAEGQRQIAIAVLVESGGSAGETASGGSVAAPIAQRVFQEFFG
jgi:penicillin-binding protein A